MSEEDKIRQVIARTVEAEKCSLFKLKNLLSREFDVILNPSDESFIEDEYVDTVIKLWFKECQQAFELKLNTLQKNRAELKEFIANFSHEVSLILFHDTHGQYGQLIRNNKNLFIESKKKAQNDLKLFMTKKIEQLQVDALEEFKFIKVLIDVIRCSNLEYKNLISALELEEYCNSQKYFSGLMHSIDDITKLILLHDFDIESYSDLKELAVEIQNKTLKIDDETFCDEITPFIAPVKISKTDSGKCLKFIGKIIFFDECFDEVNENFREIQIICDILHIRRNSNNKSVFNLNLDNLIIIANTIRVYDKVTIDLSGKDATEDEINLNGRDGNSGESGGNIFISCSKIFNSNLLSLISNGGNGTVGMNGRDGKDGEDGKDVNKENLSWDGQEFRVKLAQRTLFSHEVDKLENARGMDKDNLEKITVIKNIENILSLTYVYGFLLAKGEKGKPGADGGLGGLGGEGGYAGEIKIETTPELPVMCKIITTPGRNGDNGKAGLNGLHGTDGGDAWVYDNQYSYDASYFGLGEKKRFRIEKCNVQGKFDVWSEKENSYMRVVSEGYIPSKNTDRCRNDSKIKRARSNHAIAVCKKPTYSRTLRHTYSEFCESSLDRLKNDSMFKKIDLNFEEIDITTKIKIKTTCERPSAKKLSRTKKSVKSSKISKMASFDETKQKISKTDLKLSDYIKIFKNCESLSVEQCEEIKESLISSKSSYEVKNYFTLCFSSKDLQECDIMALWNDKAYLFNLETLFANFLKKKKTLFDNEYKQSISYPDQIEELVPYLVDTAELSENFEATQTLVTHLEFSTFSHYFNTDEETNREQIKEFYIKLREKVLKSYGFMNKFNILEFGKEEILRYEKLIFSIFKILLKYRKEFDELCNILETLESDFISVEKLEDSKKSKKEFSNVIKKFLQNKKISQFIDETLEKGPHTPIYRKILSFLFEKSFRIFVKNLNESVTLCEENNIKDFDSTSNEPMLDILLEKQKFKLLKFDKEKYVRNQRRKFIAEKCKEELMKKQLLVYFFSTDVQNIDGKILCYFNDNVENIVNECKLALNVLSKIAPMILKSISVRLFYEECIMTMKELNTIIYNVLEMLTENPFMSDYFAVMFLATHHSKWLHEIIMIKIEEYLNTPDLIEIRNHLFEVTHRDTLLLFLFKIEELIQTKELNISTADFPKIIENMKYFNDQSYEQLTVTKALTNWKFVITTGYWLSHYTFLSKNDASLIHDLHSKYGSNTLQRLLNILNSKKTKSINLKYFFENFHSGEWVLSEELFHLLKEHESNDWMKKIKEIYSTQGNQRSIDQVVQLVSEGSQTYNASKPIKESISSIGELTKRIKTLICTRKKKEFSQFTLDEIGDWIQFKSDSIEDRLAIILRVFKLKMNVDLHNTQIVSILTLWNNTQDVLLQIGTGEGKTFIGVALAILKCLNREKIHIVSSSKVLAERDAISEKNLKIFNVFNIKVGHNCSEDSDVRRRIYKDCNVIYGTLGNFQRDYLFTKFFNQNFLPFDHLQNVLVDEVDSILLDKGNNILYLSQEVPGIDELESIFIFLWQFVNQEANSLEERITLLSPKNIRDAFLDNLHGVVNEVDIQGMVGNDPNFKGKELVEKLKAIGIIDAEGCIRIENLEESIKNIEKEFEAMNLSPELSSKIVYLITQKFKSQKQIKFPKFYTKFVMHHLDKWIESAISALIMEDGREYVIDRVRDGSLIRSDPNIIIMDIDTGTDQKNSEWDEGLCQFLQLKHGCRLSLLSLKSVFISNVTYFSYYTKKYGITGTLGSKSECEKIENFFKLHYATIPTFLPKKFLEREAILEISNDEWLRKIVEETKTIFEEDRSVLVICNTISEIQIILKQFQSDESKTFNQNNIHVYQRDYEEFGLGKLEPRELIIATNLAGRGTDIKLSDQLSKNGGLHVIMTYLASNVRIENQAFGRAARAGSKGSGRLLILNLSDKTDINSIKEERNQQEFFRLDNVSSFYENFIKNEEGLFAEFSKIYTDYESQIKIIYKDFKNNESIQEILCNNLKVLWSLWLDSNSNLIADWKSQEKKIQESFKEFVKRTTHKDSIELHPIMKIRLCKYYESIGKFNDAKALCFAEKSTDLIAFEYLKAFMLMKSANCEKILEVRALLKKFSEYEIELLSRISIVNAMKQKYQRTLIPIKGYENQVNEILDAHRNVTESLTKLLGRGVTPETFQFAPFGNLIFNENFYDFLLNKEYIKSPRVDESFEKGEVEKIGRKYLVNIEDLKSILNIGKSKGIISMDGFANYLNEILCFASREKFWNALVDQKILQYETKFVLIDVRTLREYLPHYEEVIQAHFKDSKLTKLSADEKYEIFFENVTETNGKLKDSDLIALKYNLKLESDNNFKLLLQHKLVKFNSRATFNFEEFNRSKSDFRFNSFDVIDHEDFNFIKSNGVRNQIIAALVEQKILKLKSVESSMYDLNFENLEKINLGINSIYESEVISVIISKFQFRISLEMLVQNLSSDKPSHEINIYLPSKPHLSMIQDLISEFIVLPSQVNPDKYEELEKEQIFDKYLSNGGLHVIMTYLASNVRIENQAFGRAARAGSKGSGRLLILNLSDKTDINSIKEERNQQEFFRLDNVSSFYENFIKNEEGLFAEFSKIYTDYESQIKIIYKDFKNNESIQEILCNNLKVLWSLWLDSNSNLIADWKSQEKKIQESFKEFVKRTTHKDSIELHPIMKIRLCKYYESIGKFNDAKALCFAEKSTDLIAFEYLKAFMLMKSANCEKILEVRALLKKFSEYEIELLSRISIVNAMKQKYQRTLIPIKGYENQVNEILDAHRNVTESLTKLLGRGVTPETFQFAPFGNLIFNENFYDFLLNKEYIKSPRVDESFEKGEVEKIGRKYLVNIEDLKSILNIGKSKGIISMDGFANYLNEILCFASREKFWNALVDQKILQYETKFVLIDVRTLREYLPHYEEVIQAHFKDSKLTKLSADEKYEIFFENVTETNGKLKDSDLIALKYNLKLESDNNFKLLLQHKLVKFNSRATFNFEEFNRSKSDFRFNSFDVIDHEDFNFIKSNGVRNQIIAALVEQKILKLKSVESSMYDLNFENLEKINLGINSIYESEVISVIISKFQFRISLEMLVQNLSSDKPSHEINIYLPSKPHLSMIQDLISEFIVLPSQVNPDKYEELEKEQIFDKYLSRKEIINYLEKGYFDTSFVLPSKTNFESLIDSLLEKRVLFQLITEDNLKLVFEKIKLSQNPVDLIKKVFTSIKDEGTEYLCYIQSCMTGFTSIDKTIVIRRFNQDVKLFDNLAFKQIESSVKIMLERRKNFVDNKQNIIETFKDCLASFKRKEYTEKDVSMGPLQIPSEMIHFMQLKGLDYVIEITEQKYFWVYIFKVATVVVIGIAQIAAGILLTYATSGFWIQTGQMFISEGIGDIMYALGTLQSGTFKWSDYGNQKAISVIRAISISAITLGLSKLRILNNAPYQTFGDEIASRGFSGLGVLDVAKKVGVEEKKVVWRSATKMFGSEMGSNVFKAVSTSLSRNINYDLNNYLDKLLIDVGTLITDTLRKNITDGELSETINQLLNVKSEKDVEKLIMDHYNELVSTKDSIHCLLTTIHGHVDNLISAYFKSPKGLSLLMKGAAIFTRKSDFQNIFNSLNSMLLKDLKKPKEKVEINEGMQKKRNAFKLKIQKKIDSDLNQRVKVVITQNIVAPTLKLVANKGFAAATDNLTSQIKNYLKHKKEDAFEKEAVKCIQVFNSLKGNTNLTEEEVIEKQNIIQKFIKIKGGTSNPEVFAELTALDTPMGDVELVAAAKLTKLKITVEFEGTIHFFGSSDNEVGIELRDGHFPNSKDLVISNKLATYDCLQQTLKDKGVLPNETTPEQFRQQISTIIVTDPEVRAFVAQPRRKFFCDIGFCGGNFSQDDMNNDVKSKL